jgi:hypothetical protein
VTDTNKPQGSPDETGVDDATRQADEAAAQQRGEPDRMPTPEEERLAEEVAGEVDVDAVGEHYGEMARTGAEVEGEGRIGS